MPTELCKQDPRGSTIISEIFAQGTQPTEFCETHVEIEIDTETNKIANEFCPEENIETRVFIRRDPPYNPEEHKGIVPEDYQYTAPTEICDIHDENTIIEDDFDNIYDEDYFNDDDDDDFYFPPIDDNDDNNDNDDDDENNTNTNNY